jgi:DNA-directed RNA polymerase specialized sigma24 family protein
LTPRVLSPGAGAEDHALLDPKDKSQDFPVQALQAIHELRAYLDDLEATHLLKARELGASPTDIAEALGITRQAVYNKLRSIERASHEERIVIPDLEEPRER